MARIIRYIPKNVFILPSKIISLFEVIHSLDNQNNIMPKAGDNFITTLKKAHLEWGSHRHTNTRGIVYDEGYLQIPASTSRALNITNSNSTSNNIYTCNSTDGFLSTVLLKSTGCSQAGDIYAKQFHGSARLKLLGVGTSILARKLETRLELILLAQQKYYSQKFSN